MRTVDRSIVRRSLGWMLLFLPVLVAHARGESGARVMWYNVENLFDADDDPAVNDEDFLPEGKYHWTPGRYRSKVNRVAQVIGACGLPDLVGVCEVENASVLKALVYGSPLRTARYRFVHYDSPDPRGVDVALLYRADGFRVSRSRPVPARVPGGATRDLLEVTGVLASGDTLTVVLCHAPSKRGGAEKSMPRRMAAMRTLRQVFDSVCAARPGARVLAMGDFNDSPGAVSLVEGLGASLTDSGVPPCGLYNLAAPWAGREDEGSYRYKAAWNMLDQMIVTGTLLRGGGLRVAPSGLRVFSEDWLLADDKRYMGRKPRRTLPGWGYDAGGFSDHLPVYVDLIP